MTIALASVGVLALGIWAVTMFSDSRIGCALRAWAANVRAPRNLTALALPALALMVFFEAVARAAGGQPALETLVRACRILALISLAALAIGLLPVALPGWMSPEWHLRRRQERAHRQRSAPSRPGDAGGSSPAEDNALLRRLQNRRAARAARSDVIPGIVTPDLGLPRSAAWAAERPLPTTLRGARACVDAPDGWAALEPSVLAPLPPAGLEALHLDIDLVAGPAAWAGDILPSLVVATAQIPLDTTRPAWDAASLQTLTRGVPGLRLIDSFGWDNGNWLGTMRTGVGIVDDTSVTAYQWSWLDDTPGLGVMATAWCPTLSCDDFYPLFGRMAQTLDVDHDLAS